MSLSPLSRRPRLRLPAVALLLAGTALGGVAVGHDAFAQDAQSPAAQSAAQPTRIQPNTPDQRMPDFVSLVKSVKPAVVSITTRLRPDAAASVENEESGGEGGMGGLPFPFGGMPQQRHPVVEAKGSGFIIDANGTVVTNNHVVKGAQTVSVTLDDGTTLPAKVVGTDPRTDLAVLKVNAGHPLPFIALGNSSDVEPGQWVIAVGNPFGLGGTVTAGIVSARGRDIGEGPYDSFIQIDAPINRGNSGGPLFTQDGKVVGVNTAILSPSGGSIGIGFAIPSNTVKDVVAQIEKNGHVTRGYLGVEAQAVSPAIAQAMKLPGGAGSDDRGALVASVQPDSPATKADLEPGDVIRAVNGDHVGTPRDLAREIAMVAPGSNVKLDVIRDGNPRTVNVTIGTLPSGQSASNGGQEGQQPGIGLALAPLTPDVRQQLDLPDGAKGAVVAQVRPGSPAEQAGLQSGDVVLGVGQKTVSSPHEAAEPIRSASRSGQPLALRILRDGQPAYVAVTPGGGSHGSQGGQDSDQG